MRNDRLSAHEQWSLGLPEALSNEFNRGLRSIDQAFSGAARFAEGAGRHGDFNEI
jgi:enoyl-CoA hydratase